MKDFERCQENKKTEENLRFFYYKSHIDSLGMGPLSLFLASGHKQFSRTDVF